MRFLTAIKVSVSTAMEATHSRSSSRLMTWVKPALLVTVLLCSGAATGAQGRLPRDSAEDLLRIAREMTIVARYCLLVTVDDTGGPQARVMDPFEPESDMTVWMATDPSTRKVKQIREDSRALLAYEDKDSHGYVTMIGTAQVVDDLNQRKARWKPEWEAFYPGGPEGDHYVLIRFIPSRIELMSVGRGVADDPLGWRPEILIRHGDTWQRH